MGKIKLLYTNEGKLLFSKSFPEVPPVEASIYRETFVMNRFNQQMKHAIRYALPISNPNKAFEKIAFNEPLERDKIYEIECDVFFENGEVKIL